MMKKRVKVLLITAAVLLGMLGSFAAGVIFSEPVEKTLWLFRDPYPWDDCKSDSMDMKPFNLAQ